LDVAAKVQFWILMALCLGLISFLIGSILNFDVKILTENIGPSYLGRNSKGLVAKIGQRISTSQSVWIGKIMCHDHERRKIFFVLGQKPQQAPSIFKCGPRWHRTSVHLGFLISLGYNWISSFSILSTITVVDNWSKRGWKV